MKAFAILLTFAGYTLVYAAVANRGRFATDPWAGLFADAYTSNAAIATAEQGTNPNAPTF